MYAGQHRCMRKLIYFITTCIITHNYNVIKQNINVSTFGYFVRKKPRRNELWNHSKRHYLVYKSTINTYAFWSRRENQRNVVLNLMGRTATLTPQVEIESCPDYPRVFPFWIWRETTATSVPASLCHSSRRRPENFHSNMTLVRDERRKAVCIIFLNQMSPRHTSGIMYEYPQVTICFRLFLLKRSQTVTRSWLPAHRSLSWDAIAVSYFL